MSINTPDQWVVIDFGDHYRVFGSWSGSYLYGPSWKLNSGIITVTEENGYISFFGNSGSLYVCHKNSYGISSGYNLSVLEEIMGGKKEVDILPEDTDWLNLLQEE